MKKLILSIVAIATISLSSFGQAPEGFKYQAVVRNASNTILNNQAVGMRMTIQQGSIGGTTVYSETFAPTTNAYGLVNLEIGNGTVISGTFASIDWANGPFFIETAVDVTGGTSYTVMGTSQLMSVPYALYAKTSGNGQGPAGPQGIQGPAGANGAQGLQGIQGVAGTNGSNGVDGKYITSASIIAGTDSIQYTFNDNSTLIVDNARGAQGIQGVQGIQGLQGIQGVAGTNATATSPWIGVDFGSNSGAVNLTPTNWTPSDGSSSLTNLIDQAGNPTTVGLSFSTTPSSFAATVLSTTVSLASVNLSNIGGSIYKFSGSMVLTFNGLTPGAAYGVYVLGLREGASISQPVSIAGVSTVSFTQAAASQELGVNDQIGSDTSLLTNAGKYVRATPSGEIVITVGSAGYFIAGVGLQKL